MLSKGYIQQLMEPADANGDLTMVRVIPYDAQEQVFYDLVLPWHLRGESGDLQPGMELVYATFLDGTGYCLGRADGEWGQTLRGNIRVTHRLSVEDQAEFGADVSMAANLNVAGKINGIDIETSSLSSINAHRHPATSEEPGITGGPISWP